jgi:hypothetical protein
MDGNRISRSWLLAAVLAIAAVCLVPWIVHLHLSLPRHYTAAHWPRTWMVFDSVLIGSFGTTSVLALRGRPSFAPWATTTATLLVCDAWFDVSTASAADFAVSALLALTAELPMALVLYFAAGWSRRRHVAQLTHAPEKVPSIRASSEEPV